MLSYVFIFCVLFSTPTHGYTDLWNNVTTPDIKDIVNEVVNEKYVNNNFMDVVYPLVDRLNKVYPILIVTDRFWNCVVGKEYGSSLHGMNYYEFIEISSKKLFVLCYIS